MAVYEIISHSIGLYKIQKGTYSIEIFSLLSSTLGFHILNNCHVIVNFQVSLELVKVKHVALHRWTAGR